MSVQTDFRKADADWKTHVRATNDAKDFSYAFDIDMLRKDGVYYARINDMPEIFFFFLGGLTKAEWIKLDPKAESIHTNTKPSMGANTIAQSASQTDASYRASRDDMMKLLQEAASAADGGKLFLFKNKPTSERVEGQTRYRYDLSLRKEVVVSFYERLLQRKNELNLKHVDALVNTETLAYLKSAEWNNMIEDIQNNTTLTVWLDTKGIPVEAACRMRIVPPSEVVELKDKQVVASLTLTLTDVNKTLDITAPEGARSIEDILGGANKMKAR